jgi:hypothetical protein
MSRFATRRTVRIPHQHWMALQLIADLSRTSISDVLRTASERHVERYGLTFTTSGELTINPLLWPTEIVKKVEISSGDQISGGDQIF